MFKGRLGAWASLIICAIIVELLINGISALMSHNDIKTKIAIETDRTFSAEVTAHEYSEYKFVPQNNNPDLIFTDKTIDMDGYTEYKDYLWSPIVLYALDTSDDGMLANGNAAQIDLLRVLQAIENGDTWESIGINKKVAEGKVVLYIPNENSPYYQDIVDLFSITLDKGASTEIEKENLNKRVNAILGKCNKVTDIQQAVLDAQDNAHNEKKVFVGPEYIFMRYDPNRGASFRPIYCLNTVYLTANVYVKDTAEDQNNYANDVLDVIKTEKKFMRCVGWRVKDSTYNVHNVGGPLLIDP